MASLQSCHDVKMAIFIYHSHTRNGSLPIIISFSHFQLDTSVELWRRSIRNAQQFDHTHRAQAAFSRGSCGPAPNRDRGKRHMKSIREQRARLNYSCSIHGYHPSSISAFTKGLIQLVYRHFFVFLFSSLASYHTQALDVVCFHPSMCGDITASRNPVQH